ncbi:hypothetical protein ACQ4M3_06355 [Leptolyngbya sp. AN03gr2]|uniref:hypothetical protein n=1 Tax=unclassified Leptolyngbya TaxID=2650499 RepID=UPI003D3194C6
MSFQHSPPELPKLNREPPKLTHKLPQINRGDGVRSIKELNAELPFNTDRTITVKAKLPDRLAS